MLGQDVRQGYREAGAYCQNDQEFHLALARISGMDMIVREIDRLGLLSATTVVLVQEDAPQSAPPTHHSELLDAILTGDSDVAERAIRAAIEPVLQHELPVLRARFGDGPIIFGGKKVDRFEP